MNTIGVSTPVGRRTILQAGAAMGVLPMALTACVEPRSELILGPPANFLVGSSNVTLSPPWYWDGPGSTAAANTPTPISPSGGPFSGSAYQLTSTNGQAALAQGCTTTYQRNLQQNLILSSSAYVHSSFAGQFEISLILIDMSKGYPVALSSVPEITELTGAPFPAQQACITGGTCGYSPPDANGWARFWVNAQFPAPMGSMVPNFTFQFNMTLSANATGPVFGPQVAIVSTLNSPPNLYHI